MGRSSVARDTRRHRQRREGSGHAHAARRRPAPFAARPSTMPRPSSPSALADTRWRPRLDLQPRLHDLGANSLPLARFRALLRANTGLSVLVDAYLHR